MGERARSRCRERLAALAAADLGPEDARRAAIAELRRAVGFDRWCWPLTDPDTGVAMSGIAEFDLWPSLPRLIVLQEHGDIASKPDLIVAPRPTLSLSTATGGDVARSRCWRECFSPYGIGDTLMVACRDRYGCWGTVELMRDRGDRTFDEDEVRLLDAVAPTLGTLLRRSLARSWHVEAVAPRRTGPGTSAAPLPPGTMILDRELTPSGWTASIREWLAEFPAGGEMPPAMYEIGTRVLASPHGAHDLPPRVRLRTRSGPWAIVEGARLDGADEGRVVVTIRAATADEVFDLLCKAHDLTPRERQLAALLRGGLATKQVGDALRISPYTVQDHLKAIFGKTGVRSRRELLSHLTGAPSLATGSS